MLDWDGTVTEVDGLYEVVRTFGDELLYADTEDRLGVELTLNQVIAIEIESVSQPLADVVRWVRENVRVRPGFRELAFAQRPLVVSSGFHELIDPVLEREGVELEVRANRLNARRDGWQARFREAATCGVCGEQCKRSDIARLGEFAYVGDGVSDRCVALAASRVFARDGLATYLADRGAPFEPFDDLHDVLRAL